ncbi:MAG: hypothetical protein Q9174_005133, partial [Haloplaca sp. 1 TL-2023]
IANSWVGYLSNFGQNLIYGGPQVVVFGLLVATAVQWVITLGLSEVASAFPSAGVCDGLSAIVAALLPVVYFTEIHTEVYTSNARIFSHWLLHCLLHVVGLEKANAAEFFHHPIRSWYKWMEPRYSMGLGYRQCSVSTIFMNATQLGSYVQRYAYGGTDGAIHIAEEIPRPGKNIPLAMNLTMLIGFVTAFPMSFVIMYGIRDVDAVLQSPLPSAEVFYQITQSKAITTFIMSWNITYAVPQGILLVRGRAKCLPTRALNLGRAGFVCNLLSPLLVIVVGTFICFPPQLPVTTDNMNYTSVILVGLFGVIIGLWYTRGHKFQGPKIDWELLNLTACK